MIAPANPTTHVVLATDRPAVRAIFEGLENSSAPITLDKEETTIGTLAGHLPPPMEATVVVIDVASDPAAAVAVCRELRRQRPDALVVALLCCAASTTPERARLLAETGVRGMLDLYMPLAKVADVLRRVARGELAMRIEIDPGSGASLHDVFRGGHGSAAPDGAIGDEDGRLLALLARGAADGVIAQELQMSIFTVRHHIIGLRERLNLGSRTAVAAWAGAHGYYGPSTDARPRR